jgi:hypothetical protein
LSKLISNPHLHLRESIYSGGDDTLISFAFASLDKANEFMKEKKRRVRV